MEQPTFIYPEPEAGKEFYQRFQGNGKVVMLNLLKFRETADYGTNQQLAPTQALSGKEAYRLYMKLTAPILQRIGGTLTFHGKSQHFLIGPEGEKWDEVLLVEYPSAQAFLALAQDPDYLTIAGHRTAALQDSRLLPMSTR